MNAGDIGGHQIRRALDTLEAAAELGGQGFGEQGLAQARHAFQQHVAAGDQCEAQAVDHVRHTEYHMLQPFVEMGLEFLSR